LAQGSLTSEYEEWVASDEDLNQNLTKRNTQMVGVWVGRVLRFLAVGKNARERKLFALLGKVLPVTKVGSF